MKVLAVVLSLSSATSPSPAASPSPEVAPTVHTGDASTPDAPDPAVPPTDDATSPDGDSAAPEAGSDAPDAGTPDADAPDATDVPPASPEADAPEPEPAAEPDPEAPEPEPELAAEPEPEPEPEPLDDDLGELDYDPMRDSPEALSATKLVRTGIALTSVGGVLIVGAIVFGTVDPCRKAVGNSCQKEASRRAAATLAIPGVVMIGGGAAFLGVGLRRRAQLRASVALGRDGGGLVITGRF